MRASFVVAMVLSLLSTPANSQSSPRAIPGLTARDAFPAACVDCHNGETSGASRFSVLLKQWMVNVDPNKLARMQTFMPKGVTLKGKHPNTAASLKDIPAACLKCHGTASKIAPSMSRMVHAIHLTPGKENRFLTTFQGECTHCHKFNAKTAQWSIPSGPEKAP